jgi:PEP-CTERM motif
MKRLLAVAFVAACLLGATQLFAGTNILANPGFESGNLSPWFNGRNFCVSPCLPWTVLPGNPHSGTYAAMDIGNIEIRQNFTPVPVSSITDVSFWAEHPDGGVLPMAIDLFYTNGLDNEIAVSTTDANYEFFDITSSLTPGLTLDGISFFGFSGGPQGSKDITWLDDVSIIANVGTTPEPSSLIMLGSGLLIGAGALRRKLIR